MSYNIIIISILTELTQLSVVITLWHPQNLDGQCKYDVLNAIVVFTIELDTLASHLLLCY